MMVLSILSNLLWILFEKFPDIYVDCYHTEQQQLCEHKFFLTRTQGSHDHINICQCLQSFTVRYLPVALFTMKCRSEKPVMICFLFIISSALHFSRSISERVNDGSIQLKGSSAEISTLLASLLSKEASRQVARPTGLYYFTSL